MPAVHVHRVDFAVDVCWSFRDSAPHWSSSTFGGGSAVLDPFPGYTHDLDEVNRTVEHVQARWAPAWDVDLYIADREEVGRSNGFSDIVQTGHYEDSDGTKHWVRDPRRGLIFLSGKRIPPHPAITRYLVAHEYGHNVEFMLNIAFGSEDAYTGPVLPEYADLRGLPASTLHHGEGGTWHDSAAEVFACDFRILVCGVETEFWPHHGIARPETIPGLRDWWDLAGKRLSATVLDAIDAG